MFIVKRSLIQFYYNIIFNVAIGQVSTLSVTLSPRELPRFSNFSFNQKLKCSTNACDSCYLYQEVKESYNSSISYNSCIIKHVVKNILQSLPTKND